MPYFYTQQFSISVFAGETVEGLCTWRLVCERCVQSKLEKSCWLDRERRNKEKGFFGSRCPRARRDARLYLEDYAIAPAATTIGALSDASLRGGSRTSDNWSGTFFFTFGRSRVMDGKKWGQRCRPPSTTTTTITTRTEDAFTTSLGSRNSVAGIPSVTILWDSFRSERCASCHVILKERGRTWLRTDGFPSMGSY